MIRTTLVLGGALGLLAGCQPPVTVNAQNPYGAEGLNVSGTAVVRATPTLVVLRMGHDTTDSTPKAARERNDQTMKAVLASLKSVGVDAKDVQTTKYSLNPSTGRDNVTRWRCSTGLEVRVKRVDRATDILQAALNAGANRVDSVEYTIEELDKLRAQARDEACKVARAKADQYAANLGLKPGRVLSVMESDPGSWSYGRNTVAQTFVQNDRPAEAASQAESILSSGSVEVSLRVDVRYQL